jgi:hypothetical protein
MVGDMARSRQSKKPHPRAAIPVTGPADPHLWLISIVFGFGAYVVGSHGLFFSAGVWQIPLFVGLTVGLITTGVRQAAIAAGATTLFGAFLLPPALPFMAAPESSEYVLMLVLSCIVAAGVAHARARIPADSRKAFDLIVAAATVAWIIANLWFPLFATGLPVKGYGVLRAATFSEVPQPGTYRLDEEVYRRVYHLMHQGEPYYTAFRTAWTQQLSEQPAPDTVMGYRLPTMYWIWSLLPAEVFSIVYVFLALCTVGVVSAAVITGQMLGSRFAPIAAVTMAAYAMSVGITTAVTYIDLPAMSIALAGIALFVHSRVRGDRRTLWAAAGVMTAAALTREILIYLILLAALSTLLEDRGRRLRAATPWLTGLGVFSAGYAVHAFAVQSYLGTDSPVTYLRGSFEFVVNALTNFSDAFNGQDAALAGLFALGVVGAWATQRRAGRPFAAFAVAALTLPLVIMLRVGNNSVTAEGAIYNYWGMLFVPLALALWPVWVLLLPDRSPSEGIAVTAKKKRRRRP